MSGSGRVGIIKNLKQVRYDFGAMPTLSPAQSELVGKNGLFISLMVEDIHFAHPTRFAIANYLHRQLLLLRA